LKTLAAQNNRLRTASIVAQGKLFLPEQTSHSTPGRIPLMLFEVALKMGIRIQWIDLAKKFSTGDSG